MDQLNRIRLEKHKEYRRNTWLPEFFEKYKKYFSNEMVAKKVILRAIRRKFLFDVVNPEMLPYIPGIYRMRVKLTPNNLNKPDMTVNFEHFDNDVEEYFTKKGVQKNKIIHNENTDIDQIINESLKEYNDTVENDIEKILQESIKDNNDIDYDEYILNQAILESLNNNNDVHTGHTNDDHIKDQMRKDQMIKDQTSHSEFYVVIDIRDYCDNTKEPIIVNNCEYYLSDEQIVHLLKLWNKVNPESQNGLKFIQNLEYQKSLIADMNN